MAIRVLVIVLMKMGNKYLEYHYRKPDKTSNINFILELKQ